MKMTNLFVQDRLGNQEVSPLGSCFKNVRETERGFDTIPRATQETFIKDIFIQTMGNNNVD